MSTTAFTLVFLLMIGLMLLGLPIAVSMVLVGAGDSPSTTPQPYVFAGETITPADKKLRTVVSTLVSLRNTVP